MFVTANAQQTFQYNDPIADYKKASELFSLKRFSDAERIFKELSTAPYQWNEVASVGLYKRNSKLYTALCGLELRQVGASDLVEDFLANNPDHSQLNIASFILGKFYFENRKYNDVIRVFADVDKYYLTSEDAIIYNYYYGYSLFTKDKYKEALRYFKEIKNTKSKFTTSVTYFIAYCNYREGNYSDALEDFKKLENDPVYKNEVPAFITQIYFNQKKYDEVISYAKPIANRTELKGIDEINKVLGSSYYMKGNFENAFQYLSKPASLGKANSAEIYQFGYSAFKINKHNDAVSAFSRLASSEDSLGQNAAWHLGQSLIILDQKEKARSSFALAAKLNFDKKIKEYSKFYYAQLSFEQGLSSTALTGFQEFIKEYPNSKYANKAKELLGNLLLDAKDFEKALSILESLGSLDYSNKRVYQKAAFYRGIELFNQGDFKAANSLFDKALKYQVERKFETETYFWKGESYYRLNDFSQSIINHQKFISYYQENMGFKLEVSPLVSNYTIAYSYQKQGNLSAAQTFYLKAQSNIESVGENKVVNTLGLAIPADISLRIADLYLNGSSYTPAKQYYQNVIDKKYPGSDYATFQMAIIQGLTGDKNGKIATLDRLISTQPNSAYLDNAIIEISNEYFQANNFNQAIRYIDRLMNERPKSALVKRGLLIRGLIYFNQENYEKAIDDYKKVVTDYPNSQEAADALRSLEQLYVTVNRVEEYLAFTANIPMARPTELKQDSLSFQAAESMFSRTNDCNELIKGMSSYLTKYPSGVFSLKAHYLRGDCYYRSALFNEALVDFEMVALKPSSMYSEPSLIGAGKISLQKKNFEKAYKYFKDVEVFAQSEFNKIESRKGLIKACFELKKFDELKGYANKLKAMPGVRPEVLSFADLHLGKTEMELANIKAARPFFDRTYQRSKDEMGAEALYNIAVIQLQENKLDSTENTIFLLSEKIPYYQYWIAKSFILLADVYATKKNYFQAIATLEEIINNYKGEDLLTIARKRLEEIKELERSQKSGGGN